jgi:DNA-binding NarL/FixJ family response regulator
VISVVVADDQELIREGLATVLSAQADIEVVGLAADGAEAVRLVRELRPQVTLMDVRMPGVDGLEATRRLLSGGDAPTRVLVLTTFDEDTLVMEALRAGASAFLLKDVPTRRLVEAVRAVHDGELLLSPTITRRLVERHLERGATDHSGTLAQLTPRELDVLRRVVAGDSNAEIGARLHLSESTVKTHVGSLLAKVGARDRVHLVIFGYEAGVNS